MEQIDQYNHLQICIVNICSGWRQRCCIIILYTSSRDNIHHPNDSCMLSVMHKWKRVLYNYYVL